MKKCVFKEVIEGEVVECKQTEKTASKKLYVSERFQKEMQILNDKGEINLLNIYFFQSMFYSINLYLVIDYSHVQVQDFICNAHKQKIEKDERYRKMREKANLEEAKELIKKYGVSENPFFSPEKEVEEKQYKYNYTQNVIKNANFF